MKWVKSYLDDQVTGKWKLFFNHRLAQFGGKLVFWGNLSPKDVRLLNLRDPFLAEIMEYWTTLNYKDNNLDFTSAQIWHNSLIRIENKPIFYKSWFTAGVKDVKDILDTDGKSILSYTAFTAKYKIKTNFLEFYKVVSAVKLFRQKCSQQPNRGPKTKTFGQTLLASEKACKTVYKSIIDPMRVAMMAKIVITADIAKIEMILQRASMKVAISEETWNLAKIRQSVVNKSNDIALHSALTAGHPGKLARSGPGDEVMNP